MLSMPRIVRPDLFRIRGIEIGSPAEPATRQSIKRNKELAEASDRETTQSRNTGPFCYGLCSNKKELAS
jgi:hypothetical protein